MIRIALAGFLHETNTFSPIPTTYESFSSRSSLLCGIYAGAEFEREFRGKSYNNSICGFYAEVEKYGYEVVPLVKIGEAEPSGTIPQALFNQLLTLLIDTLKAHAPYDGVYLDLHGAMVFEPFQEGEAEILRRVREVVGGIPIVASLDLHGNISKETFDLASALDGYRTYPHVDIYDTGVRCARILRHLIDGKPLFKAYHQIPFLMPGSTLSTNREPCKSLYATIDEVEKDKNIISASIMQGFVEADVEHMGPSVFAYGTTQEAAEKAANRLLQAALEREPQFTAELPNARQAVEMAIEYSRTEKRPVILADGQDNPGGGASSDTVWILEELIHQHAPDSAVALLYDPEAAAMAHAAGEGKEIELPLGGKLTPGHKPLFGKYTVVRLHEGDFICTGSMVGGMPVNLGKMAQLMIDNIRIVVASHRTQILDQTYMRIVGVEPSEMKILVLKSTNHYRADFEPISSHIIDVEAPSALINNPAKWTYKNLRDGVRLQGMGPANQKQKA